MYLVELEFDGSPERFQFRPAHREKLAALKTAGLLEAAGPFEDQSGAFLLFKVDTSAEVDRIMADDPYYQAKGTTVVRKQKWEPLPL